MHILFPMLGLSSGAAGSDDYHHSIATRLAQRGHTITIVTLGGVRPPVLNESVRWIRLEPPPSLPAVWRVEHLVRLLHAKRAIRALDCPSPDVVFSGVLPLLEALRSHLPRVPQVYVPHSMIAAKEMMTYPGTLLQKYSGAACYEFLQRRAWHRSHTVVCFTQLSAAIKARRYGSPPKRLVITPPGVDVNPIPRAGARFWLEQTTGIPRDAFLIISIGRLEKIKDFAMLLEAFASPDVPQNAHLLLVGDGSEADSLKRRAAELSVGKRAYFVGFQSDVDRFLACADVYAMTSLLESFGLTLIRALAHGVPVVARRARYPDVLTASDDIVEDGVSGRLFDTATELGMTLRQLAEDRTTRSQMTLNAMHSAQQYSWDKHVDSIEEALHRSLQ